MQALYLLYQYNKFNPLEQERIREEFKNDFGITGNLKQQIAAKITAHNLRQARREVPEIQKKANDDFDYYKELFAIGKHIGQPNPEMLLIEYCGYIKGIKEQSNDSGSDSTANRGRSKR